MTDDQRPVERSPGGRQVGGERLDGAGAGEPDVRALLHRAVAEVQPDPAALTRIQRAVPRRQARQRHLWTGAAAVVLLTVAAVPTIHSADRIDLSDSPATGRAIAETDEASTAGTGGDQATTRPHAPRPASSGAVPVSSPSDVLTTSAGPSTPTVAGGAPEGSASVPACRRADLGQASSHLAAADSSGKVYGSFTVLNTSGRSCALTGAGTVQIGAVSGTDPAQVKVVDHRAGDPAGGLPDPSTAPTSLVLQPLAGYQVQFGWVPDAQCPSSRSTATATGGGATAAGAPAAGGSSAAGSSGARAADSGGPATGSPAAGPPAVGPTGTANPDVSASPTASPTASATPTAAQPTITLIHTPQSGGPAAASAVVSGACSGTVYRAAPQAVPPATATASPAAGG